MDSTFHIGNSSTVSSVPAADQITRRLEQDFENSLSGTLVEAEARPSPDLSATHPAFVHTTNRVSEVTKYVYEMRKKWTAWVEEQERDSDEDLETLALKERQTAEAEAIIRVRREKLQVKTAELNAVKRDLAREEAANLVQITRRTTRRAKVLQEMEAERILNFLNGTSFLQHLHVNYKSRPGQCLCPEGKVVASIVGSEEECNYWTCPSNRPAPAVADVLMPPSQPRPQNPNVFPDDELVEPTAELFPSS